MQRIQDVIIHAWSDSTLETYGTGLLTFHVYCDTKAIPELQRAPASPILISAFVSALAGTYSGSAIKNYVYGVRAWHILHGAPWKLNDDEIDALMTGSARTAPTTSRRKKRRPYTPQYISTLREKFNLNDPVDAAAFACLTTTFYTAARLGEFTVPRLGGFNPLIHVKPSDVSDQQDLQGNKVKSFHIPRTKTTPAGEDIHWAKQHGSTDPEAAFANHLAVNQPPPNGALFAYKWKNTHRPLTKTKLLTRIAEASKAAGLDPLQGHGIRIGATLEYLLRGHSFEVVKQIGRWSSEAFTGYLTKHAQILAPYLQAAPEVHDAVIRYTMPPVR